MRRAAVLALATAAFVMPFAVGAQTASAPPPNSTQAQPQTPTKTAAAVTISPADQRLLTPEQEGRQGIVKGVVDQSFRDFGIMESRIPVVLIAAMADPYARVAPVSCEELAVRIRELDAALGPDLDAPVNTEHPSMMKKGKVQARDATLDALRGTVQNYIPFDPYIRIVSGADRHDHRVLDAIRAGSMRRAYLKGLGESMSCPAPATPRHLAHPVAVAADQPGKHHWFGLP